MGYDGKKIVEANRLKSVGGREVGNFWIWRKYDVVIFIIFAIFFLLLVLALSIAFSPTTSLPRQEQQQQKRQLEPLVPPLLFHGFKLTPRPLPPSERQKRKSAMIPIHWSDHHGGHHGHHGHHDYRDYSTPYYYTPYYDYRPRGYYSFPYNQYDYGYREREEPRCFELRQHDGTHLKWCL